jgi:RNA polymerase sigma-70 factor (ECF subfamily)
MKILRSIGMFNPGLGLRTWIYQIAHNSAIDHIRKKSFFPAEARRSLTSASRFGDPADPSAGPEQRAETASLRRRIDEALDGFSERERAVFILRHYHDLKLKEIAEALHFSVGTAKSYLFRSLRKLQKALDDVEPRPENGGRP